MIKNIIWDVDGTMFDTYPAIARSFMAALEAMGHSGDEREVFELAKISLNVCGRTLAERYGLDLEDFMDRFEAHYRETGPEGQPPFPGVEAVCAAAAEAGGLNVIATHRGRAGLERLLGHYGMRHWFADIRTADDGFARKPDPGMFNALIEENRLDRDETLALGDRELDIQAGAAAGVRTGFFGEWAGEGRPDWVGTDYADLIDWLKAS